MWLIGYDIGDCPRCGSNMTGRILPYLPSNFGGGNASQMVSDALRQGELVRYTSVPGKMTTFCKNCGLEWSGKVKVRLISPIQRFKMIIDSYKYKDEADSIEKETISLQDIDGFEDYEFPVKTKSQKKHNTSLIKKSFISAINPLTGIKSMFRSVTNDLGSLGSDFLDVPISKNKKEDNEDDIWPNEHENANKKLRRFVPEGNDSFGIDI